MLTCQALSKKINTILTNLLQNRPYNPYFEGQANLGLEINN